MTKTSIHKKYQKDENSLHCLQKLKANWQKKTKPSTRNMELEKTLEGIKNQLATISGSVEKIAVLDQKLDSICADLSNFKHDVADLKVQIKDLEKKQNGSYTQINENQIQINIINQLRLDNQIMITDVPLHITKDNFISNVNDWSKNLLKSLGYKKLAIIKSKKSSTAFIHFWNVKDKYRFMDHVRTHIKHDDKYIPITNEQIFILGAPQKLLI